MSLALGALKSPRRELGIANVLRKAAISAHISHLPLAETVDSHSRGMVACHARRPIMPMSRLIVQISVSISEMPDKYESWFVDKGMAVVHKRRSFLAR